MAGSEGAAAAVRGRGWMGMLIAALLGVVVGGGAVALSSGYLVKRALLQNPEILPEAMTRLREREAANVVARNRAAFETPFAAAWTGAADGDVVLVEFFDYACPYCHKSNADLERLLREDPKLKVVWRDMPVLGPDSEEAALASLAAAQAGRYREFYTTLFSFGRPTPDAVERARQAAGLDPGAVAAMRSSPAAQQEIGKNRALAQAIGASGTPTFVVGDRVLNGAVGYDALKEAISQARERG